MVRAVKLERSGSGTYFNASQGVFYPENGGGGSTVGGDLPSPASSLAATPAGTSQIKLSWTDNSSNEAGFRIERRGGKAAFAGRVLPVAAVFRSRGAVTFLAVWLGVNLLMGLGFGTPGMEGRIAWEAHIGGFLAGFLLIRLFDRAPDADREHRQPT